MKVTIKYCGPSGSIMAGIAELDIEGMMVGEVFEARVLPQDQTRGTDPVKLRLIAETIDFEKLEVCAKVAP